jgi:hypothetical protein
MPIPHRMGTLSGLSLGLPTVFGRPGTPRRGKVGVLGLCIRSRSEHRDGFFVAGSSSAIIAVTMTKFQIVVFPGDLIVNRIPATEVASGLGYSLAAGRVIKSGIPHVKEGALIIFGLQDAKEWPFPPGLDLDFEMSPLGVFQLREGDLRAEVRQKQGKPVPIEESKTDGYGHAVHEPCIVAKLVQAREPFDSNGHPDTDEKSA